MRTGHENPDTPLSAHGIFGRTACVTRSSAKNVQFLASPSKFIFKEIAQQLHGHILEGQGGAIGESLQIELWLFVAWRLERFERNNALGTEHCRCVCFVT